MKIFIDTNRMYADDRVIFKKIEFGGDFPKLVREISAINKIEKHIEICIPEIVLLEFKKQCVEKFKKSKKEIDESLTKYKKIFGDNLKLSANLKWKDEEEYATYLNFEINKYIELHSEFLKIVNTPDCFQKMIDSAINQGPLFKEVSKNNKTYKDAGFKDTLIYETMISDLDDKVIFFSSDSDFDEINKHNDNIHLAKDINDLYSKLDEFIPEFSILNVLSRLSNGSPKDMILENLNVCPEGNIEVVEYYKDYFNFNSEENSIELKVKLRIGTHDHVVFLCYDKIANAILSCFEE